MAGKLALGSWTGTELARGEASVEAREPCGLVLGASPGFRVGRKANARFAESGSKRERDASTMGWRWARIAPAVEDAD